MKKILCLVAITVLCCVAPAMGQEKIGELEMLDLGTNHPYSAADHQREWVVHFPSADYIRVHFSQFDLAFGDSVRIMSMDGSQNFEYTGKGPHGNSSFWAFSILGDTAILQLNAGNGGGFGFEVDSFGRGISIEGPGGGIGGIGETPESVCGTQDWADVECYRNSYPTEFGNAEAAVKAVIGCCTSCTAFKISDSGQFMFNNHCASTDNAVQSTELQIRYQASSCGSSASIESSVMATEMLATDYTLDYTLMDTGGGGGSIPCLALDERLADMGEQIHIAHHPSGGPKKLSIVSTHSSNPGFCEVDASPYNGRGTNSDVGYYCDTIGGSSGSPVISTSTGKVVAVHHFGGCLNSGGRSDQIASQLSGVLDECVVVPSTCDGGVIDPGEDCDGTDLGGETCVSQGFDSGVLACSGSCSFDTSGCDLACMPKGDTCEVNSDCCSNKCKGKPGRKSCK
ncbi:MAG: trypsin-like peptidase domain-containing protein [Acidobacteria bacterium]|uniref:Trypsin-like peptidase domain-containing protein n=1 Tax=Candidatus Polarisedimenticola svalbardensis TaxID=2886004 RepID=A0A8J7C1T6_9BACT|nr:trypsin-like peptidase domain-containing protein [Candidatus Polarisedimenticola svalbardensis]